jgi:16S rRNA processing protein RimM
METKDLLATATIGSSFGIRGEVKVYPNNEGHDYLKNVRKVVLLLSNGSTRQAEIIGKRVVGGQLLCSFQGYDAPEKAKELARAIMLVPRENAYPLKDGEVYVADLIGCSLVYQEKTLATVVATIDGPQGLLLEAKGENGVNHLVPYLSAYVGATDIQAKTIQLRVDWILA